MFLNSFAYIYLKNLKDQLSGKPLRGLLCSLMFYYLPQLNSYDFIIFSHV